MFTSLNWLPWIFWTIATVASVLYGAFAVAIFVRPAERPPTAWLWHQRWLNFVGSMTGWLALWLLFVRHCGWPVQSCGREPGWWDAIGALVAFVGVTGYLPFTIVGLISGARALSMKAGSLVEKLLPK